MRIRAHVQSERMIITLSGIYFAFDASNLIMLLLVSSPVLAFRHYYIDYAMLA
jgi:hypothetical protein